MECFTYDSDTLQDELETSPHVAGEVEFLRSIAKPAVQVIEAGANRGGPAVAIAREIGEAGRLYAFEPVTISKADASRSTAGPPLTF